MNRRRHIGLEHRDGVHVGRDPRNMTAAELEQVGHHRLSPLKALRLKCLDCCNMSAQEVRLCTAVDCPSWPFRMGRNPWRSQLDQEERLALQARFTGNSASEVTEAQKTGAQIAASPSDGGGVQSGLSTEFSTVSAGEKKPGGRA